MAFKRNRYQFTGKSHSRKGIAVCIGAAILLLLFLIFILKAVNNVGTLSVYYGAWGVGALFLAALMLILAIQSLFEEDSFPLFPRLGFALDLLAFICWGGSYAIGLGLF